MLIKLQNLTKEYLSKEKTKVLALKGISMQINKGEFVSIMGPSGSGKTTLMNIIGLLDSVSSGKYFLDSENTANLSDGQKTKLRSNKVGFIFQSFNLISNVTVIKNVVIPNFYHHRSLNGGYQKALRLLNEVGLKERINHYPTELSGGEKQRVAIARALINDPQIILADEPTGNLDKNTSSEVIQILNNLNKSGVTIILVTHSEQVAKYAQKIFYLEKGKMIAQIITDKTTQMTTDNLC